VLEVIMLRLRRRSKVLQVKTTGGTTAQILGLMNALYLCKRTGRGFQIQHFPSTTGTFWPLGIKEILFPNEIASSGTTLVSMDSGLATGTYIEDFPLRKKGWNWYKFLYFLQLIGLDVPLRRLRGEVVIRGEKRRLNLVNERTRSVSGNFVPLVDEYVFTQLSIRFERANLPNPFDGKKDMTKECILIHYRLGDMRKMPSRVAGIGGHGVVDPTVFLEIIQRGKREWDSYEIGVVSDEPEIAVQLLREVGIKCVISSTGNVWQDLVTISTAKIFIGSMSQFSIVGATTVIARGNTAILPANVYGQGDLRELLDIPEITFVDFRYLPESHWLFHR
jgi:hypothetical protein